MKASKFIIGKIKEFEGFREKAYKCSAGVWTCGYGHTRGVYPWTQFSLEKAEEKLKEDISEVEEQLNAWCDVFGELNQNQFDSILDFIFNIGFSKFRKSTLAKMIANNPNDENIGKEIFRWRFCQGKELKGLVIRRTFEQIHYYDT